MLLETRGEETQVIPEFVYKERLPNGLRVLVHEMPWAQSVSARLLIQAGPRYEEESGDKTTIGCAHYLEHMFFEGSQNYPSRRDLDRAVEGRGGDHSAYTDKEYVMYQAKLPSEHADFATAFVRELAFNPLMLEEAVAREKGIITAELRRSIDNPSQQRWNLLREFVWKGHPLGHNTLGTFDSIQAINRDDLIAYHQRFYRPDNAILVIAGNTTRSQAVDMATRDFGDLRANPQLGVEVPPPIFTELAPRVFIENKDLKETHALLAFSTEGRGETHPQLPKVQVLARMLRNSIFHKFVYDLGISYSAGCWPWLVSDNGSIVIAAGVAPERTEEAIEAMVSEVNSLKVTDESVGEAKEALKGELTLNLADTDDYAHFIGEQELYGGKVRSPEQVKARIDSVTPTEIDNLRKGLITNRTAALVLLGPVSTDKTEVFEEILQFV